MTFIASILEILGPDPRILEADRLLGTMLQGRVKTLNVSAEVMHHCLLSIVGDPTDEANGISETIAWLQKRESCLLSLDARITVEIECVLLKNDASRFLSIRPEHLAVLADLECGLRFQYMKSLESG